MEVGLVSGGGTGLALLLAFFEGAGSLSGLNGMGIVVRLKVG